MSNLKKYCILVAIYNIGFMFCSGAIMQTFLLQIGFTAEMVYLLSSLMQFAQVVMMVVMMFLSSKIKKVKFFTGISYLSLVILSVVFLIGAINPSIVQKPYIVAVFIAAGVSYLGVGFYNILVYCLPYYIIDMKEYGKMTGISCMLAGGTLFAVSSLHALVVSKFSYTEAMVWFFILAIVSLVLTSLICLSMKEISNQGKENKTTKDDVIAVFKNKDTYLLLIPNFARGLATGVMGVIAVIGISTSILNEVSTAYVNIVIQVSLFLGNLFYVIFYRKFSSTNLLLISTIACAVFLPLCIQGGLIWFLIMLFIALFFRMVIDTLIPVVVTEIIPKNQIGAFTSIRMLVFTGAQAVATLIITPIVSVVGYTGLLIFTSIMQIICGLVYYVVAVKEKAKLKK